MSDQKNEQEREGEPGLGAPAEAPARVFILHGQKSELGGGVVAAAGLAGSSAQFMLSFLEASGASVAASESWDEMSKAVESGLVDAVFFHPGTFFKASLEYDSCPRAAWCARQARAGVGFVAFDWRARHFPAKPGHEPDPITGVGASVDMFYLAGSAQTILESARAARVAREALALHESVHSALSAQAPRRAL